MKIEHIAMYVNELEKARDFFIKYFGAVSNEGYHNKNTGFRSYFLIAFSVGSREKVDALTARLKEDGFEVVSGPRTTGDGYYESCIAGIEGNQIEITV